MADLHNKQRGVALVVVMWVITLIIIMASSFALTIRRETAILADFKTLAQANAMAEAGINIAIKQMLNVDQQARWRSDGTIYELQIDEVPIRITIADESGKIDINQTDGQMLRTILIGRGLKEQDAEKLVSAIIDWRDPDDLLSLNGAEKEEYKAARLTYVPRNKPFETVEELQLVLGMTPVLFSQLEPLITVYSQAKDVNPAKASRELLLGTPNATPALVDAYLQERAQNARAGAPETPPTWLGTAPGGGGSQTFQITAEAMPVEGVSAAVSAVVKQGQSRSGLPFAILKWTKGSNFGSLFTDANNNLIISL